MRNILLVGLLTGCGFISEDRLDLRLDSDQDGIGIDEDCDSSDPAIGPKQTFYADLDGDGFGDENSPIEACFIPEDAAENALDCDDSDATVHPGAEDQWYDGIDSDCDGSSDCDKDGDGFDGSDDNGLPTDACPNATDCNDEDPDVMPVEGATEIYFNGEDDDCNVATGDGDSDGDGFWHIDYVELVEANGRMPLSIPEGQGGDCYDAVADSASGFDPEIINGDGGVFDPEDVNPDATETYYDGVDANCDGLSDFDQDGDGFASSEFPNRDGVIGTDCLDQGDLFGMLAADINPDAVEVFYDGVDANCDGWNDFDQDGDGDLISGYDCDSDGTIDTSCDFDNDGVAEFTAGSDCNDEDASVSSFQDEGIVDGVDQNCDGFELCFVDQDGDGQGGDDEGYSSDLTCTAVGFANSATDCDDDDVTVYTGAAEICDGIDNSCDGSLGSLEIDTDGDGYVACTIDVNGWEGDPLVVGGDDCVEGDDTSYPGGTEVVDGVDNDCDGALLSEEADLDGDGFISGIIDANGWSGQNTVQEGDCDDNNAMQYPGAAMNDDPTACLLDADGDGYADPTLNNGIGSDCDDGNENTYPSAPEICDGVVNDCSGLILSLDETDDDMDDFVECTIHSSGWVGDPLILGGDDCDDANIDINPNSTWYEDLDEDGVGTNADVVQACTPPSVAYALEVGDCDDQDENVYPYAPETNDGVDNNCDGVESNTGYEVCVGVPQGEHYYLGCDLPETWIDADTVCQTLGYDGLALVQTSEQNSVAADLMFPVLGGSEYWIGLSDDAVEGDFVWVNGDSVTQTNWVLSQPDNYNTNGSSSPANCVTALSGSDGDWQDDFCFTSHPFVCSMGM